jgi:hypothetical protein
MMDGSGAGFVSSGSCGVDIPESSACNYKVQVYYQGIRNLDAFALLFPLSERLFSVFSALGEKANS